MLKRKQERVLCIMHEYIKRNLTIGAVNGNLDSYTCWITKNNVSKLTVDKLCQ